MGWPWVLLPLPYGMALVLLLSVVELLAEKLAASPPHRWKAQEVGAAAALPGASGTHPGQLSRRLLLAGEPLQAALPGWAAGALFPHPQGTSELPEECSFLPFQSTYRLLTVQRRLSEVGSVKIMTKPLPSRAMRSDPSPGMVPFLKHWTEILPLS